MPKPPFAHLRRLPLAKLRWQLLAYLRHASTLPGSGYRKSSSQYLMMSRLQACSGGEEGEGKGGVGGIERGSERPSDKLLSQSRAGMDVAVDTASF